MVVTVDIYCNSQFCSFFFSFAFKENKMYGPCHKVRYTIQHSAAGGE